MQEENADMDLLPYAVRNIFRPMENLSKAVRRLRRGLGMNQGDFANHIGASQSSVSRWEAGTVEPEYKWTQKFAEIDPNWRGDEPGGGRSEPPRLPANDTEDSDLEGLPVTPEDFARRVYEASSDILNDLIRHKLLDIPPELAHDYSRAISEVAEYDFVGREGNRQSIIDRLRADLTHYRKIHRK